MDGWKGIYYVRVEGREISDVHSMDEWPIMEMGVGGVVRIWGCGEKC